MHLYLDLEKAITPKAPGDSKPKGASAAGGQDVRYVQKKHVRNKPKNAVGETKNSWIVPQGGGGKAPAAEETPAAMNPKVPEVATPAATKPPAVLTPPPKPGKLTVTNASAPKNNPIAKPKVVPTADEHNKIAELAGKTGNKKLAEKHKLLAVSAPDGDSPPASSAPSEKPKKEEPKIKPENNAHHAVHAIHTNKAKETQAKAREILSRVSKDQKPALEKIISALDAHHSQEHVPTPSEKKELREFASAVGDMAKPIDKKRESVKKEFDKKMSDTEKQKKTEAKQKEKEKLKAQSDKIKKLEKEEKVKSTESRKLVLKTEKEKLRTMERESKAKKQAEDKKNKEDLRKQKDEIRKQEKADNEVISQARKQLATKDKAKKAEQKKLMLKKDKLTEKITAQNRKPGSIEEHAAHTAHTSEAKELDSKITELLKQHKDNPEITRVLTAFQSVAHNQMGLKRIPSKEDVKALKDARAAMTKVNKDQEQKLKQAEEEGTNTLVTNERNKTTTMDAYHQGRSQGEEVAHSTTQDDAGAGISGKAAGAIGTGTVTAGHHLLTNKQEEESKKRVVKQSSLEKSLSAPSEAISIIKSLTSRIREAIPTVSDSEYDFLVNVKGYNPEDVRKGMVAIKGIDQSRYSDYLNNKALKSVDLLKRF